MERIPNLRNLLTWAIFSLLSFSPAESATQMTPLDQAVPDGETFALTCVSRRVRTNGSRLHNQLYRVDGSSRSFLSLSQVDTCEASYTMQGPDRATVTTVFRLQAGVDSAGGYGCIPVVENATLPTTFTKRQRDREVTVRVCSEPELQVDSSMADGELISVRASELCGHKGELTWRVNGRQAPQGSTAQRFPVVDEDNSLEMRRCRGSNTCQVTAVFTYISTEKRVRSASETIEIADCCVQDAFLAAEVQTNAETTSETPPAAPFNPLDAITNNRQLEAEKHMQEKEVLSLQKQVLELKLEALPMQIKFLRRLNRDHSQGRDMEKVEDI